MSKTTGAVSAIFCLASIGCLIGWISLNAKQNSELPLSQRKCLDICGGYYYYEKPGQRCCNYNQYSCRSKQSCKQDMDAEYAQQKLALQSTAICLMVACIALCICNCKSCKSTQQLHNQGSRDSQNGGSLSYNVYQPPGDQNSIQNRLPSSFVYRESKTVCAVCLQPFNEGDKSMLLDCGHVFHSKCIRSWMDQQDNCPLCRQTV